ncbi:OPT family small oligopeptide transporter, partial [Ramicandelaber brevisporus]
DDEEDSPHFEVRAAVSNKDDPTLPSLTFRVILLGLIFTAALSFVNQFFAFRAQPVGLSVLVVQILSFPLGKLLSWLLPRTQFSTFGWKWSLNPGDFSIKEHVLISVFSNAGSGTAYAINIVVIKKMFYAADLGFGPSLLLLFTTQMVGYGLAGVCRQFLVYPSAMVWPSKLANVVLFRTFHESSLWSGWSRTKMFWVCFAGSFVWFWVPGYLFTMLSLFSLLCMFDRDSILFGQLSSGQYGLGILNFTLDWTTVAPANLGSPILSPFWAICNMFASFVLIMWILTPALYYSNTWDAQNYPIYFWRTFDVYGKQYDTDRVKTKALTLNETAYYEYSPLKMPAEYALSFGLGFAALTCVLSYIFLNHRHEIWARLRDSRNQPADIHLKLMRAYPEVPQWWYATLFVVFFVLGIVTCEVWDLQIRWYMFFLCMALPLVFTVPIGMVQAVTNLQPGLHILTQLVFGYISPGNPIGTLTFKTYGYITMSQALDLTADLKLGQYMKIPPKHLFICQSLGTLLAALVQLAVSYWLMGTVQDLCVAKPGNPWNCAQIVHFFSGSVIWGLVGPYKTFNDQGYSILLHGFWVGALLPVPFYFLAKRYPTSWIRHVYVPVIIGNAGWLPSTPPASYVWWFVVGAFFNYYLRRYKTDWWSKYAYSLSAGLDSGLAISTILIFFIVQNNGVELDWWGNNPSCRNENKPTRIAPAAPTANA